MIPIWRTDGAFLAYVILVVVFAYLACAAPPDMAGLFFGFACLVGTVAARCRSESEGD